VLILLRTQVENYTLFMQLLHLFGVMFENVEYHIRCQIAFYLMLGLLR